MWVLVASAASSACALLSWILFLNSSSVACDTLLPTLAARSAAPAALMLGRVLLFLAVITAAGSEAAEAAAVCYAPH